VNSYPAAAAAPNGDLYATWTTEDEDDGSVAMWSKSTDGGQTWTAPARVFAPATRTPIGYPVAQPSGGTLDAPDPAGPWRTSSRRWRSRRRDGRLQRLPGDVVSPWQTCAARTLAREQDQLPASGRLHPQHPVDYWVTTAPHSVVSTHPINTRNGFGGGFFGDYTDIAYGSDGALHAFWTDSNNKQTVVWWFGLEFVPTPINQEDVAVWNGTF
jgi:hypothetical protein